MVVVVVAPVEETAVNGVTGILLTGAREACGWGAFPLFLFLFFLFAIVKLKKAGYFVGDWLREVQLRLRDKSCSALDGSR